MIDLIVKIEPSRYQELEELARKLKTPLKDTINLALTLLERIAVETQDGFELALVKHNGNGDVSKERLLTIPQIDALRPVG